MYFIPSNNKTNFDIRIVGRKSKMPPNLKYISPRAPGLLTDGHFDQRNF
jgi:hypothetical protein